MTLTCSGRGELEARQAGEGRVSWVGGKSGAGRRRARALRSRIALRNPALSWAAGILPWSTSASYAGARTLARTDLNMLPTTGDCLRSEAGRMSAPLKGGARSTRASRRRAAPSPPRLVQEVASLTRSAGLMASKPGAFSRFTRICDAGLRSRVCAGTGPIGRALRAKPRQRGRQSASTHHQVLHRLQADRPVAHHLGAAHHGVDQAGRQQQVQRRGGDHDLLRLDDDHLEPAQHVRRVARARGVRVPAPWSGPRGAAWGRV